MTDSVGCEVEPVGAHGVAACGGRVLGPGCDPVADVEHCRTTLGMVGGRIAQQPIPGGHPAGLVFGEQATVGPFAASVVRQGGEHHPGARAARYGDGVVQALSNVAVVDGVSESSPATRNVRVIVSHRPAITTARCGRSLLKACRQCPLQPRQPGRRADSGRSTGTAR